jgi:hypothetical protein
MSTVFSLCAVYPDKSEKIFGGYFYNKEDADKHLEFLIKDQTALYQETRDKEGVPCVWKVTSHPKPEEKI